MKLWFERGAWASAGGRTKIAQLQPKSVRRIAVIRHAALGDMVLVRPFLVELRRFFPEAEITLSVVSNYTLGVPNDLIDRLHILPGSGSIRISLRDQILRAKELGPTDILFDLADTVRSRYLTLLTDAKIKIGFPYRWYLRNLLFDAAVFRSDFVFEAQNMMDTLLLLGAQTSYPLDFGWPNESISEQSASRFQIVYFPFASHQKKCWSEVNFKKLIRRSAQTFTYIDHLVLEGSAEWEGLECYEDISKDYPNVYLQKRLPLDRVNQLLKGVNLVISNDTGIRNLAIALDIPTLGIFFQTVPHRYLPLYGQHKAVFNADGDQPTVEDVFQVQENMVSKLVEAKKISIPSARAPVLS